MAHTKQFLYEDVAQTGAHMNEELASAPAPGENISITPGALFSSTGKIRNFLRLCAGQPFNDHIAAGIQRLGELAQSQRIPRNPIQ